MLAASGASGGVIGSAQTDVTNPYEAIPCGCIYCFVCLVQRLEAEEGEGWICLRCGELVKECKPWSGDVLEAKPTASSKTVGFLDQPKEDSTETDSTEAQKDEEKAIEQGNIPAGIDESQQWADADAEAEAADDIDVDDGASDVFEETPDEDE
jgi:peroxin-2